MNDENLHRLSADEIARLRKDCDTQDIVGFVVCSQFCSIRDALGDVLNFLENAYAIIDELDEEVRTICLTNE